MVNQVRTILGDVDASQLGYTMPHEHILDNPAVGGYIDGDHILNNYDKALQMLREYKAIGGAAIGEASPAHWGRNTAGMARLSEQTGVHIICCTGYLCEAQCDMSVWVGEKTIDQLAGEMINEVTRGMDGTQCKAGWIKCGTSYNYISPREERVLRAAARASRETGAPVHSHTSVGTMGLELIDILESEGMEPSHIAIAHVDRNPDYWYHRKLLEKGVYLIYDGPGKAKYHPDSLRVELLKKLVDDGFSHRLMLSNDMGKRSHHTVYGKGPGWQWIKQRFLPRLLEEGFTQDTIDCFMVSNPAAFYTLYQ